MSFSTSFRATSPNGVENPEQITSRVAAADAGASQTVRDTHQIQVALAFKAIEALCIEHPDKTIVGSIYGHSREEGDGNVGISYSFSPV